jgi:hypothetical protein
VEKALPNPTSIEVTRFASNERQLVRTLCADVAYEGRPLEEWIPIDRELFADFFTAYYTDLEPNSSFVAWADGSFAGYVLTALDTKTHVRAWRRHILLPALYRVMTGRYKIPFSTIPQLVRLGVAYARCRSLHIPMDEYPGHLHINISHQYRRFPDVARMLLHRAVRNFRDHGVSGMHGIVMTSRMRMVKKYERAGFKILARCPAPRPSPRSQGTPYWLLIAMRIDSLGDQPFSSQAIRERSRNGSLAGARADC